MCAWSVVYFAGHVLTAQTGIQVMADSLGWRVADMHYHISYSPYNQHALDLHPRMDVDAVISDTLFWINNTDALAVRYGGKLVRPENPNEVSNLSNYDQATMPHSRDGNVKLGFNAISPYEFKTVERSFNRLIHRRVSGASMDWLSKVADWDSMTHFDNFLYEYRFSAAQESGNTHHNFKWKFLRSGDELSRDDSTMYVVNVIEGAHALQGKFFHPLTDPFSLSRRRNVMRMLRDTSLNVTFKDSIDITDYSLEQISKVDHVLEESADPAVMTWDTTKIRNVRRLHRNGIVYYDEHALEQTILNELKANIDSLKSLDPPVFMVTVGHFAYNGMVNHALAYDVGGVFAPVIRRFYRVRVDDDPDLVRDWEQLFYAPPLPVTRYGDSLVQWLVNTDNGHRIHIDLKHSGYPTRLWFYQLAAEKGLKPIFSHGAVAGLKEIHYSPVSDEYAYSDSRAIETFSPFSINLYDEEIARICALDGMIGITLDERRLGGYQKFGDRKDEMLAQLQALRGLPVIDTVIEAIRREIPEIAASPDSAYMILRDDYVSAEPFMQNLFYMLDYMYVHNDSTFRSAWRHLCFGSDFNGGIDPIDILPTASQYPYFRNRLRQLIPVFLQINRKRYTREYYNGSFTLDDALDLLFYESLRDFVRDNFIR